MRTVIFIAATIFCSGCTSAPTPRGARQLSGVSLAELSMAATATPERDCVHSTIRTTFGIFLVHFAEATDARIHAELTDGLSGPPLAQREREFQTWTRTHDPYLVGDQHLRWCLAESVLLTPLARVTDCLRTAEPSVLMATFLKTGTSRLESMVRIKKRYPGRFSVADLNALADRVSGITFPDDLSLQTELIAQCLREESA